jgi:hypothetical protein
MSIIENTTGADAIIHQARKAMQLPDTIFRTEYDLNNTLAANLERLEAAASLAPSRVDEVDALKAQWRKRADQWRENKKRGAGAPLLASSADYLAALQEQDDEAAAAEADDANKAKRKRQTKKDRLAAKQSAKEGDDADAATAQQDGMGERGASLEMHLAVLRGESAPNPRRPDGKGAERVSPVTTPRSAARRAVEEDERRRGAVITLETIVDPPVIETAAVMPYEVLSSSAAIRLIENSPSAEVVFDVMGTVSEEEAAAAAALHAPQAGGRRRGGGDAQPPRKSPTGKSGSRSPSRPSTPTSSSAAALPAGTKIDCRLTILRGVLRSLIHLSTRQATASPSTSSPTAALPSSTSGAATIEAVPTLDIATVQAVLGTIVYGTETKVLKVLRRIAAAQQKGLAPASVNAAASMADDDDEGGDGGMPPPNASVITAEYSTPLHSERMADADFDEEGDIEELSAQLVAEFEAQQTADLLAEAEEDFAMGRTGLPTTIGDRVMLVSLPRLRDAPMAVLMCHGGSFAGAIFVCGTAVVHKSFTRYVVRKKQGGKQSSQGAATNSAGSQIRKMQETRWREDVKRILDDWRPLLDCCWVIAYVAPGPQNKKIITDFSVDWTPRVASAMPPAVPELTAFFDKSAGIFKPTDPLKSPVNMQHDPRVISAPMTTHKPIFAEVERIYQALRSFRIERIYRRPPTTNSH